MSTARMTSVPTVDLNDGHGSGDDGLSLMSTTPEHGPWRVSPTEAADVLAARDPVLAALIAAAGPIRICRRTGSHFTALVEAIVYQQLAGGAARAIHARLVAALDDDVVPEALLALSDETLRAVGLSSNKVRSLHDLATRVLDGTVVLSPHELSCESDEQIIARLSTVRGIGPWTAQMFLMFRLQRLDVWPVADFGVRQGYGLAWNVPTPTARELERLGEPYRPYRTVAAWYCWRAVDLFSGAADSALAPMRLALARMHLPNGHDLQQSGATP
jgi:DNA-3-methyladenine glycosylase II